MKISAPTQDGVVEFPCPFCQAKNQVKVSASAGSDLQVELPSWWKEKPAMGSNSLSSVPSDVLAAIQTLVEETWKPITTRDRGFTPVKKLQVIHVQQNANPKLWQNYVLAREKIKKKMTEHDVITAATSDVLDRINAKAGRSDKPLLGSLDESVNEFLLFHGTKPSACDNICKSDFMVSLAGTSAGSLYGPGIYFGENSSKSDEYATDDASGIYKDLYAMLLCRVTCGRMLYTEEVSPDKQTLVDKCTSKGADFNSVLGDREKAKGTYRELVLFNNDQAYPEYVVIYRRDT